MKTIRLPLIDAELSDTVLTIDKQYKAAQVAREVLRDKVFPKIPLPLFSLAVFLGFLLNPTYHPMAIFSYLVASAIITCASGALSRKSKSKLLRREVNEGLWSICTTTAWTYAFSLVVSAWTIFWVHTGMMLLIIGFLGLMYLWMGRYMKRTEKLRENPFYYLACMSGAIRETLAKHQAQTPPPPTTEVTTVVTPTISDPSLN